MATQSEIAEGGNIVSSNQIDYIQKVFSHPTYRYMPQFPNTYGQPIALNTSQTPVVVNLPPEVFNLAQSYVYFQINLPAAGAGLYTWTPADAYSGAISHIQHYCGSGQFIADIDNLQNYMKIVAKKETAMNDFLALDPTNGLYPSNSLNNAVPALRNGTTNVPNPSSLSYIEPAYYNVSGVNTQVVINCMLPLRLIKNSVFSIDKDLYYGGQLSYLKFFMGPIAKAAYNSTVNTGPSDGTRTSWPALVSATINNFQVLLAVENNPIMKQMIMDKVNSAGLSMYIPYVQSFKNTNSGGSQNISIQLDAGSGKTLQKVVHSVFNSNEDLDTAYDCANISSASGTGGKVYTYWTQLNGKRLQDINIDSQTYALTSPPTATLYTDYMSQRRMLRGSVLENRNVYQFNWFHCDDFTEFGAAADQEGRSELIAGIPMGTMPLTWSFVGNAMQSSTFFHYTYVVLSKKLTMTGSILTVE